MQKLVLLMLFILPSAYTVNTDLNFDFSGHKLLSKLLVSSCTDIVKQANKAFGQSENDNGVIQMPSTNKDKPHVQCVTDARMSKAVKFTLYKNDDDRGINTDRSRLEMHATAGRSNLLASKNSNFVYAWWFQLDSTLKVGNAFFHIFQLKARPMEQNPIVTFQLKKDGLYLRIGHDPNTPDNVVYKKLLSLSAVVGRWIQAYVEVQYSTSSSGYVHVTLKDQNGAQLYDARVVGPTFPPTSQPQTIYPKWGLYHGNDNAYQSSDWELFQNIQIWKK